MLDIFGILDAVIEQSAEDGTDDFAVTGQALVLLVCVTEFVLVERDVVDSFNHVPVFVLIGRGQQADVLEDMVCGLQGFAHFLKFVAMVG